MTMAIVILTAIALILFAARVAYTAGTARGFSDCYKLMQEYGKERI